MTLGSRVFLFFFFVILTFFILVWLNADKNPNNRFIYRLADSFNS